MSSILDALNKLEKDQAQAELKDPVQDLDPIEAQEELAGHRAFGDGFNIRLTPLVAIGGGIAALVLLVTISVSVSLFMLRPTVAPQQVTQLASTQGLVSAALKSPPPPAPAPTDVQSSDVSETAIAEPWPQPKGEPPAADPVPTAVEAPVAVKASSVLPPLERVADPRGDLPEEVGAKDFSSESARSREPVAVAGERNALPVPTPDPPPELPALQAPQAVVSGDGPRDAGPATDRALAPARTREPIRNPVPVEVEAPGAGDRDGLAPQKGSALWGWREPAAAQADTLAPPDPSRAGGRKRSAGEVAGPESQSWIRPIGGSQGRSDTPSRPAAWTSDEPLSALPVLTDGVRARHRTGPFNLTLKHVKSSSNAYAVAVINALAVYEGETIHNTGMRLVKVAEEGLAVEITATGKLYFVPF